MRKRFGILFLLASLFVRSQSLISSNTYIQACIDNTQCSLINNSSHLFYDENSSTVYLKIDFATFKANQDSIDDWLGDLKGTFLYYKAHLPQEAFRGLNNHVHKTLKLHGQLYLNGVWHNKVIEITLFSTENSILSSNTNGNTYDDVKANFSFSISPKDFKLHKGPHHLRKAIFIGVSLGRFNLLPSNGRVLLGEAYDH